VLQKKNKEKKSSFRIFSRKVGEKMRVDTKRCEKNFHLLANEGKRNGKILKSTEIDFLLRPVPSFDRKKANSQVEGNFCLNFTEKITPKG
jgi:hypothetical protein